MKRLGLVILGAVWVACSAPQPMAMSDGGAAVQMGPVPAFTLVDVNPNSSLNGQSITPGSFAGKVTGWYFGHSS